MCTVLTSYILYVVDATLKYWNNMFTDKWVLLNQHQAITHNDTKRLPIPVGHKHHHHHQQRPLVVNVSIPWNVALMRTTVSTHKGSVMVSQIALMEVMSRIAVSLLQRHVICMNKCNICCSEIVLIHSKTQRIQYLSQ